MVGYYVKGEVMESNGGGKGDGVLLCKRDVGRKSRAGADGEEVRGER